MKLIAKGPITAHQQDGPPKEIAEGDTFEAEGAKAKWLVDIGAAEAPKSADEQPDA